MNTNPAQINTNYLCRICIHLWIKGFKNLKNYSFILKFYCTKIH